MQTQKNSAVRTQGNAHAEPINLTKRIGSTNYKVSVHFSTTSRETISDKMLRLMKNDAKQIKSDASNIANPVSLTRTGTEFRKAAGE